MSKYFSGSFYVLGVLTGLTLLLWFIITAPKTVTISSKQFICTEAVPVGISTECVEYRKAGR